MPTDILGEAIQACNAFGISLIANPVRSRCAALAMLGLAVAVVGDLALRAQSIPPAPGVRVLRDLRIDGEVWPADINTDGRTDLLSSSQVCVPSFCSGNVQVSIGRGDGTFDAPVVSTVHGAVVGSADFNRDGFRDVIATSPTGVVIVPGNGTAMLGSAVAVATDGASFALSGDLDVDGKRDLVVPSANGLAVYPGNGDFTFGMPAIVGTAAANDGIIADLNGDGRRDIVTAGGSSPFSVSIFLNHGSLTFTTAEILLDSLPMDVTAADVNRDGHMDLLVAAGRPETIYGFGEGEMFVLLGKGDGTFQPPTEYSVLSGPTQIVGGDFNRDGIVDVVTGNRSAIVRDDCTEVVKTWDTVSLFVGLGNGTFTGPWNFSIGDQRFSDPSDSSGSTRYSNTLVSLNTNDLNHDGATDLIVSHGAVLLNIPALANHAPTVDAGPNVLWDSPTDLVLSPAASDPDDDLLTWEIRDSNGAVVATYPKACVWPGTYTVTVNDGHGHQASDTWVYGAIPLTGTGTFTGDLDIGSVGAGGTATYDSATETYMVSSSGADIWGTADEFHFVATTSAALGDFTITALVNAVDNVSPWTKAGIMIRENVHAGARHASLFVTPSRGLAFQRRTVDNGTSIHTAGPAVTAPVWVKLQRRGDVITAYSRPAITDAWTVVGRQTLINLASKVALGLAVTSHADGTLATASFSHVQIGSVPPSMGAALGAGSGSMTTNGVGFTITGRGADIWDNADSFFYAYTRWSGEIVTITARVRSLTNTHVWAKVGVMLREELTAGSRHVMAAVTPARGVSLQYRPTPGGISVQAGNVPGTAPGWVRLARNGTTFTSSWSSDGVNWRTVASIQLPFATDFYVGLPVTSHNPSATATALFDDVSLSVE